MWSQYKNRVFRSTPACPRDHEVLLWHGRGNKRLLCLTKYTSTGNNTNTHTFTSKMLFRTFWGFCYLLSCCYRIDSCMCCQHILPLICCCCGMSRQCWDIFMTWESSLFSVTHEKKTISKLVDWMEMTRRLISPTMHVLFLGACHVFVQTWNNLRTVSSRTGDAIRPLSRSAGG